MQFLQVFEAARATARAAMFDKWLAGATLRKIIYLIKRNVKVDLRISRATQI